MKIIGQKLLVKMKARMRIVLLLLPCLATLTFGLDVGVVISRARRALEEEDRVNMESGAKSTTRRKVTKRSVKVTFLCT